MLKILSSNQIRHVDQFTIKKEPITSIDLMEPSSPLLQTIDRLPTKSCVAIHSVIGDKCGVLPKHKSDGVVPVHSARDPRACSECYVRARHGMVNKEREAIKEVVRILDEHLMTGATTVQLARLNGILDR